MCLFFALLMMKLVRNWIVNVAYGWNSNKRHKKEGVWIVTLLKIIPTT